jgi:pimeloyl-ACP methyl ester carboxylesterase
MNGRINNIICSSLCVIIAIGLVISVGISILSNGSISPTQALLAQQQQPRSNFTTAEQKLLKEGNSFEIDNVTFSHHTATVNDIQLHYVMGGKGDPVVLLHGYPQSWYEWRHIMPALAKNYTVIAPDLRGFGDSSKPTTGYDGNTTAEDIYQLVSQLGFDDIFMVAHDLGVQSAYSYAAAHPDNVSKLVIMEYAFPGFFPPQFGESGPWWFAFHQVPNLPESVIEGNEREYISYFLKGLAYNPSAITEEDIDVYARHASSPDGMRAQFEYYRAFPVNEEQNKETAKNKLTMPVLVLGGDIYPALGGDFPGNFVLTSMQSLAENVTGVTVPLSGHWIPEEQPEFLIEQLAKFFNQ